MNEVELQHGKVYKVTKDVLNWSEGDLFRCDIRPERVFLIILKYKKLNARSAHSMDFRFLLPVLEMVK